MLEENTCYELTQRQKEVLALLRKGLTNQEICKALNISPNTVKVHLANIYKILEVTNRTEAVSVLTYKASSKSTVQLLFFGLEKLKSNESAHFFFLSLVKNLHRFELLNIQVAPPDSQNSSSDFWVNTNFSDGRTPTLFLSLHHTNSPEILWSTSFSFSKNDDLELEVSRLTIHLWRQIELASARLYKQDASLEPKWWYLTSYHRIKTEARTKESWLEAKEALHALAQEKEPSIYVSFILATIHYKALLERWCPLSEYESRIRELAAHAMRFNAGSQYSMFIIALANILAGDNNHSISYLKKITAINPLCIRTRNLLAQLYMLQGKEDLGLEEVSFYEKMNIDFVDQPYNCATKAILLFLAKRFNECIQFCSEILFIMPETVIPRITMISVLGWEHRSEEAKKHVELFKKHHPNFKLDQLGNVIQGIHYEKMDIVLQGLSLANMKI